MQVAFSNEGPLRPKLTCPSHSVSFNMLVAVHSLRNGQHRPAQQVFQINPGNCPGSRKLIRTWRIAQKMHLPDCYLVFLKHVPISCCFREETFCFILFQLLFQCFESIMALLNRFSTFCLRESPDGIAVFRAVPRYLVRLRLIAVAMLSVLTCLFASLGILCWYRARERPGQGQFSGKVPSASGLKFRSGLIRDVGKNGRNMYLLMFVGSLWLMMDSFTVLLSLCLYNHLSTVSINYIVWRSSFSNLFLYIAISSISHLFACLSIYLFNCLTNPCVFTFRVCVRVSS